MYLPQYFKPEAYGSRSVFMPSMFTNSCLPLLRAVRLLMIFVLSGCVSSPRRLADAIRSLSICCACLKLVATRTTSSANRKFVSLRISSCCCMCNPWPGVPQCPTPDFATRRKTSADPNSVGSDQIGSDRTESDRIG